jgi:PAS domain S-box-containing protein
VTEDALAESEERLRLALDAARMGTFDWDVPSGRVTASARYSELWGFKPGEFDGSSGAVRDRVHPDDRERLTEAVEYSTATRTSFNREFRAVWPDGSVHWLATLGAFTFDAGGRPARLRGVVMEVTEQRKADARIRQLNRVYAVMSAIDKVIVREQEVQSVLDAACRIAVEQGEFRMAWIGLTDAADAALRVVAYAGMTNETLRIVRALAGSGPGSGGCAFTAAALLTGESAVCNEIARDPRATGWRGAAIERGCLAMVSLPLTDGQRVAGTFNLYAGEAGFFDEDELRLLAGLASDISFALKVHEQGADRRRVEKALQESDDRFRELAENMQDVFWMISPDRKTLFYVNPAYERIWGRTCASLYEDPSTWMEAVHPDDRAYVSRGIADKSTNGGFEETYRILRSDGTVRWIRDRAYTVTSPTGEILRVVGTAQDITERRQLEEQYRQSQKMEAVGQLAGGIAHDINNILTVIQGYASMLPGEAEPGAADDSVRQIVLAADRAADLTRRLLAFSRRQVMQLRVVDLNDVVVGMTQMLQRIVGADVHLRLDLASTRLLTRADPGLLDQALMNLVVNAREAMPSGGQLVIETREVPGAVKTGDGASGSALCLRVSDTGAGIPPEHLSRIFEPFFTTKEPGKGTGLGLAIVFGIVEQHDGSITVTSEVGRGTTFEIQLVPDAAQAEDARAELTGPEPRRGTETILLVEDEPSVRRLTRVVLERQGYRVLSAANGVEALQVWAEHQASIKLLITDIVMPEGISGRDLAARLQADTANLDVIFISGYSAEIAGQPLALPERQVFLQKPFSPAQFLDTVSRCFER